jgi:hypothetical protein
MLEVVQYQEYLLIAQVIEQLQIKFLWPLERELQGIRNCGREVAGRADRSKRNKVDPLQKCPFMRYVRGCLQSEPGLSDAPGTNQRDQSAGRVSQQLGSLTQLLFSPNERSEVGRKVVWIWL